MFPISIGGSLKLPPLLREEIPPILDAIEREIGWAQAVDVVREESRITVGSALFRFRWTSNWNIFAPLGRGTIEIEAGSPAILRYRFSTVGLLLFATLGVAFLGLPASEGVGYLSELPFLALGWLWLFGMNYAISSIRMPLFLKKAARSGFEVDLVVSRGGTVEPEPSLWDKFASH